jgi:nucleoside-diphosphate-sugar epimerase
LTKPAIRGRAWHVPSNPPVTIRSLAQRFFEVTGGPAVKVTALPRWLPRLAAPFNPWVRELVEMDYQFYRPFVLDSSAATRTFGLTATPLDEARRRHVPGLIGTTSRKLWPQQGREATTSGKL